jgi:hypothetical protein
VPWEEPGLADEFKLRPFPHRRWLARLYHSVKPIDRQAGVEYADFKSLRSDVPIVPQGSTVTAR